MREIEPAPDVVFADLPDGGVVVHTGTKRYYSLNETGARIWGLLESAGSLSHAASTIAAEYGLSMDDANRAVADLTEQLVSVGLLKKVAEARA